MGQTIPVPRIFATWSKYTITKAMITITATAEQMIQSRRVFGRDSSIFHLFSTLGSLMQALSHFLCGDTVRNFANGRVFATFLASSQPRRPSQMPNLRLSKSVG